MKPQQALNRRSFPRQLRVSEVIRHALANIFSRGDLRSDILETAFLTISEIKISSDYKHAIIFVVPLGGKDYPAILKALREESPHLRSLVAQTVQLRYTPKLDFRYDESFDEAQAINQLLNDPHVRQDL